METIVNKIAESGLISLDLQDYLPKEEELAGFDLKDFLFMGLILKGKGLPGRSSGAGLVCL